MILCAICNREARGFGFCLSLRFDLYPHHHFCSMRCLDRGEAIAREANGMIDKTAREIEAPASGTLVQKAAADETYECGTEIGEIV